MIILRLLNFISKPRAVYAHCDIPCGIYETNTVLLAARTVVRMVEVIQALPDGNPRVQDRNTFVRCIKVKEDHAQLCKEQLFVLWGDFFKPEHLEKFPDLHDKIWKAVKLASDNKHGVNMEKAKQLEEAIREISGIFDKVRVGPKEDLAGSISDSPDSPMKKLLGVSAKK